MNLEDGIFWNLTSLYLREYSLSTHRCLEASCIRVQLDGKGTG